MSSLRELVCIESAPGLTVGKSYEVYDGRVGKVRVKDNDKNFAWYPDTLFKSRHQASEGSYYTEQNYEDPEVGGFFAYEGWAFETTYAHERDNLLRGWGKTPRQAVASLMALLDEQDGEAWGNEPINLI